MEFQSKAESAFPKLPSLLKWLSTASEAELKPIRPVTMIWLPNLYPSLTFNTEKYTIRISDNSDLYIPLLEILPTWESTQAVVAVRIVDPNQGLFAVQTLDGETAEWEQLGEFGRRLTVRDRKARKGR